MQSSELVRLCLCVIVLRRVLFACIVDFMIDIVLCYFSFFSHHSDRKSQQSRPQQAFTIATATTPRSTSQPLLLINPESTSSVPIHSHNHLISPRYYISVMSLPPRLYLSSSPSKHAPTSITHIPPPNQTPCKHHPSNPLISSNQDSSQ